MLQPSKFNLQVIIFCLFFLTGIFPCDQILSQDSENNPTIESPQAGWQNLITEEVILSLPQRYFGGHPEKNIKTITDKLKAIDNNYLSRLEILKQNSNRILLIAFDTQNSNSDFIDNVNIVSEKTTKQISLEEYLAANIQQLSANYQIERQEISKIKNDRIGQIITKTTFENISFQQLVYIVKKENIFYIVTYSTSTTDFPQKLPEFKKSMQTLQLITKKDKQ